MDSLLRHAQTDRQPTDFPSHQVTLDENAFIDVVAARFLEPYKIRVTFSDGFVQTVDFERFLTNSLNPHIRKYLEVALFADFTVQNGDLQWHSYDLCFPVADLYENRI